MKSTISYVAIAPYRALIKSFKSLESKVFITVHLPYPFIRFRISLLLFSELNKGKQENLNPITSYSLTKDIYYESEGYIINRFLIVDGNNLLFQMFFGMPARIVNKRGKAIQGTLGFVGALLKIIRRIEPTHVVVLFDGEHENTRSELNADYKANRFDYSQTPEEETPFSQLPDVYAALAYLDIKFAETETCETDDWVASYALTYGQEIEIIISSFDSDFFQLITDKVSVLRYRGDSTVICTPDYIKNKYSIEPQQYADFKSLVGDTSDNIKGADKVGPKTAAYLLNKFGTLDNILVNAESIEKPSIRDSIIRNTERLRTNYKIIKLNNTAQLPFALNNLVYIFTEETTTGVLNGIGLY